MKAVALVTSLVVDEDADLDPVRQALNSLGIQGRIECWDDPSVRWDRYDLVVLRSTWNYPSALGSFLNWIREVEQFVPVLNPSAIAAWNSDKHYLRDLEEVGLPTIETVFLEPGKTAEAIGSTFERDIVVKPAIGAGGRDAAWHSSPRDADAHIARLIKAGRSVLVQPHVGEIDQSGETGLAYFDGRFSHAFGKAALLHRDAPPSAAIYLREEISPRRATVEERAVGDAVVGAFAQNLLYARVDVVRRPGRGPVIVELELIEPSFFFRVAPQAADVFARAIEKRVEER